MRECDLPFRVDAVVTSSVRHRIAAMDVTILAVLLAAMIGCSENTEAPPMEVAAHDSQQSNTEIEAVSHLAFGEADAAAIEEFLNSKVALMSSEELAKMTVSYRLGYLAALMIAQEKLNAIPKQLIDHENDVVALNAMMIAFDKRRTVLESASMEQRCKELERRLMARLNVPIPRWWINGVASGKPNSDQRTAPVCVQSGELLYYVEAFSKSVSMMKRGKVIPLHSRMVEHLSVHHPVTRGPAVASDAGVIAIFTLFEHPDQELPDRWFSGPLILFDLATGKEMWSAEVTRGLPRDAAERGPQPPPKCEIVIGEKHIVVFFANYGYGKYTLDSFNRHDGTWHATLGYY